MLTKPKLADEKIIAALRENYGIVARELQYLALGNDTFAGVYRVIAADKTDFFLKVKRDGIAPLSLTLPHYLCTNGLSHVVAPLPTRANLLSVPCAEFTLILYPFIHGASAMHRELTETQWREYGAIVNQIHATKLTANLAAQIAREDFSPVWVDTRAALAQKIAQGDFETEAQRALAQKWNEQKSAIEMLAQSTLALARKLPSQTHEFVLCHADIHANNILVADDGQLYVVDWDQPIFAPRERDLFFMMDAVIARRLTTKQRALFFQGYGTIHINEDAIAYYTCDWAMQDICDFAARVLLLPDADIETQQDAFSWFNLQFTPDGMAEIGLRLGAKRL